MILKFKKLHENAVIPKYAKPGDVGLDLTAVSYKYIREAECPYYEYKFGLAVEIPEGYVGLITPRSSASNKDLILANTIGIIDQGFRGELTARLKELPFNDSYKDSPTIYNIGDRVCQLVIVPCPQFTPVEVGKLSETERGDSGFGSSGR